MEAQQFASPPSAGWAAVVQNENPAAPAWEEQPWSGSVRSPFQGRNDLRRAPLSLVSLQETSFSPRAFAGVSVSASYRLTIPLSAACSSTCPLPAAGPPSARHCGSSPIRPSAEFIRGVPSNNLWTFPNPAQSPIHCNGNLPSGRGASSIVIILADHTGETARNLSPQAKILRFHSGWAGAHC